MAHCMKGDLYKSHVGDAGYIRALCPEVCCIGSAEQKSMIYKFLHKTNLRLVTN